MIEKKNDNYFVRKILDDINFIIENTKELTKERFEKDKILSRGLLFYLIQLTENSKRISEEFKRKNTLVPWNQIIGLRNRVVHDYGNVDVGVVYNTLLYDVPHLKDLFEKVIENKKRIWSGVSYEKKWSIWLFSD